MELGTAHALLVPNFPDTFPTTKHLQSILDENQALLGIILDCQRVGKSTECMAYQEKLHQNLKYLMYWAEQMQCAKNGSTVFE